MRHFIVFRDPESWDTPDAKRDAFRARSTKRVDRTEHNRVWVFSQARSRGEYYLVSTFVVTKTSHTGSNRNPYLMAAEDGQRFGRPFVVSTDSWWAGVMRATGGMKWGLTELKDRKAISALMKIAATAAPPRPRPYTPTAGGRRFASSPIARKVEKAATRAATAALRADGWKVLSVEQENRGFDLLCSRDGAQLHVEVKGTSAPEPLFSLTCNEKDTMDRDPQFRLLLVTSALSHPQVTLLTAKQVKSQFLLEPAGWVGRKH